jgi:hypothetical protein
LSDVSQFALVLAGLVHDVNHPGVTASFLLRASMDHLSDFAASMIGDDPVARRNSAKIRRNKLRQSNIIKNSRQMSLCSDGGEEALAQANKERGERRRLLSKNISLGYISPSIKQRAGGDSKVRSASTSTQSTTTRHQQQQQQTKNSRAYSLNDDRRLGKAPSSSLSSPLSSSPQTLGSRLDMRISSGGVSSMEGVIRVDEENNFDSEDEDDREEERGSFDYGGGEYGYSTDEGEDVIFSPFDRELAVRYNDQSPLEHMHLAITFSLLRREENNFLSQDMLASIRSVLVKAILGTDMSNHSEQMARLDALIENVKAEEEGRSGAIPWYWPIKPPPALKTPVEKKEWALMLQEGFIVELFLHAADIGSPAMPFEQFRKWNRLCQEEFFVQGEMEIAVSVLKYIYIL